MRDVSCSGISSRQEGLSSSHPVEDAGLQIEGGPAMCSG